MNVHPKQRDYLERVDEILPLVEERAGAAEAQGHLTDDVVAAMRSSGLYTMMYPAAVGGGDATLVEMMRVVERLSHAHASVGWCTMVNNMEGMMMAAFIADEGIATVFANGPDITIAGNGVPRGFARPVDGGYMIRGRWAYGSGIHHAEWIHTGCFITDQEGNMVMGEDGPKIIITHHPRDTIKLLGNWDVLGLRATGSYDYTLPDGQEELFVPATMTYRFDDTVPLRGGPQCGLGLAGLSAFGHTSWALGVGRRVLDELAKVIVERTDPFGKSADSPSFRFQFAQAEARYRAARALAYETWLAIDARAMKGEAQPLEAVTMAKLCLRHLHDVISDVATFAHRAARGASLHATPMQRVYRDIHAGTQHILMADQIVEECGRALLGLTGENAEWTVFGIKG